MAMSRLRRMLGTVLLVPSVASAVVAFGGVTGFCGPCARVTDALTGGYRMVLASDGADAEPDGFRRTVRPNSVDLHEQYDTSDALIPLEEMHTLLPRDAIPALTDPSTESVEQTSGWLRPDDRVVLATAGDDAYVAPLRVLDFHEIVNITLSGDPIAITYCPLCDSASVISRVVKDGEGDAQVLEFGVSGALYNSNVLMYDRTHRGLWSQLAMKAITGPMAGTRLETRPVRVVPFSAVSKRHPHARVLSRETGHQRDYSGDAYAGFFARDGLLVDVRRFDDDLPPKTLGLGVLAGGEAFFVPIHQLSEGDTLAFDTPLGVVEVRRAGGSGGTGVGGVEVVSAPEKVIATAQALYYAWSAFHREVRVVTPAEEPSPSGEPSSEQ